MCLSFRVYNRQERPIVSQVVASSNLFVPCHMHECRDRSLKIDVKCRYGLSWDEDKTRLRRAGIVDKVGKNRTNVTVFGFTRGKNARLSHKL
jgi:hypothetical protein